MTTAKEAHDIAKELLAAWPKSKFAQYLGHWNELMLYLDAKVREEDSASP